MLLTGASWPEAVGATLWEERKGAPGRGGEGLKNDDAEHKQERWRERCEQTLVVAVEGMRVVDNEGLAAAVVVVVVVVE